MAGSPMRAADGEISYGTAGQNVGIMGALGGEIGAAIDAEALEPDMYTDVPAPPHHKCARQPAGPFRGWLSD